jgi:hypothetical protein
MLTRNDYIAILEKKAEDTVHTDSQEAAIKDYESNMSDNRTYLKGLFDQAGAVEKDESKQISKLFPGKEDKESGHVFLKVARQLFDSAFDAVEVGYVKTSAAPYKEVAFRGFINELEKTGAIDSAFHQAALQKGQPMPGAKAGPTALDKLTAQNKIRQSMSTGRVWDATKGTSAGGGLGGATRAATGALSKLGRAMEQLGFNQ